MKIIKIALTIALGMPALFAQTYSQPVREVEKEAYSSVYGNCPLFWGSSEEVSRICPIYTVPSDKILAIRQVSVYCSGRSGDNFAVNLQTQNRGGGVYGLSYIPLTASASFNPARHPIAKASTIPVFHHAAPGTVVRFFVNFDGQQVNAFPAGCQLNFQGYLLPAVQ